MTPVPVRRMAAMNRRVWNDISDPWQRRREKEFDWRHFRRGGTALSADAHRVMGSVRGTTLLDMQCGSGEAALSWANRGARVTGVDGSERRLAEARRKADLAGLRVGYVRGNVVRLPFRPASFDRVYTGGGIVAWIPNARAWARQIARVLKPGGKFLYWDRHPFTLCLVERKGGKLALGGARGGYFDNRPLVYYGMTQWMKRPKLLPHVERNWKLMDLFNALVGANLRLVRVEEISPPRRHTNLYDSAPRGQERAYPRPLRMAWEQTRR